MASQGSSNRMRMPKGLFISSIIGLASMVGGSGAMVYNNSKKPEELPRIEEIGLELMHRYSRKDLAERGGQLLQEYKDLTRERNRLQSASDFREKEINYNTNQGISGLVVIAGFVLAGGSLLFSLRRKTSYDN